MEQSLLSMLITFFEMPPHLRTFRLQREITTEIKNYRLRLVQIELPPETGDDASFSSAKP